MFFSMLLAAAFPLFPQEAARGQTRPGDPLPFLGMGLAELLGRLGPPEAVYALRGKEDWQDDVVFVYTEGDFYIFRDRVWQVAVKSLYGVALGDPKTAALLALPAVGELQDRGDYALLTLPGGWQRRLRVNFNGGRVSAIFIYRSDF